MKKDNKRKVLYLMGYIYISFFALICLLPFWFVLTGSFMDESEIITTGFKLWPQKFSVFSYNMLLQFPDTIINAYGVSSIITVTGAVAGLFITSMTAYVLNRRDFAYRNHFALFFFFTMLFSGGLVTYYLLVIKYLHLKNSLLALILPSLLSAWNIILMRNFMRSIPDSIIESAKIDGAGDFTIFIKLVLPISTPGLATVGLFIALEYWNDWFNAMLFIENEKLYPLQYMLYKLIQRVQGLQSASARGAALGYFIQLPEESLKMATAVVAIGPIILLYPFVQKYFVKGLTIGAVKG